MKGKTFDDVKKEVKVELGIPFDIQYPYTQEEKTMITETDQVNAEKGERRTETHKFPGEHRLARFKASRGRRR